VSAAESQSAMRGPFAPNWLVADEASMTEASASDATGVIDSVNRSGSEPPAPSARAPNTRWTFIGVPPVCVFSMTHATPSVDE